MSSIIETENVSRSATAECTKPLKVLYILGAGRSGSTVLDTVLGAHPDVESVGELVNLQRAGWLLREYCACGLRGNECDYWQKVFAEWRELSGEATPERYVQLQQRFERLRSVPFLPVRRRTEEYAQYLRWTHATLEAIRRHSGKKVIVDSSKLPFRGWTLSVLPDIDLRVIHLVRDPRGVAWSLRKGYKRDDRGGIQRDMPGRSVWRTAMSWSVMNAFSERWLRSLERATWIRLRYEEFVSDPAEALGRIGCLVDLDFSAVAEALTAGDSIRVGHTIAGNRVRMTGSIRLRYDDEWRTALPDQDRRIVNLLTRRQRERYGYRS